MAREEEFQLTKYSQADREFLAKINAKVASHAKKATNADTAIPAFPASNEITTSDITIDAKDITNADIKNGAAIYELRIVTAPFELYIDKGASQLSWERNEPIPFNPKSLHQIAFSELSEILRVKDLVQPSPDFLPSADAHYLMQSRNKWQQIQDINRTGNTQYNRLMEDPSLIRKIQYDIYSPKMLRYLYSFGADNTSLFERGRISLAQPNTATWTPEATSWSFSNHRDNTSLQHPAFASSLARKINQLVVSHI